MTKIIIWGSFIIFTCLYVQYADIYSKKCKDAGGTSILAIDGPVCLHPTSTLEVE